MRVIATHSWLLVLLFVGCNLPQPQPGPAQGNETPPPSGASCMSTLDCGPDDFCVEQHCRQTRTSAAGEVLAAEAAEHERQSHHAAAVAGYGAAIDAYRKGGVNVPADLFCSLSTASLRGATTREARELAAQQADQCLRASHAGLPSRTETVQLLAMLHVEGLDPLHFDETRPAAVFFTAEPDRPKGDSIEIEFDLPERDSPGFSELTAGLRTTEARDAVSRCFIADWETQRQNRSEVALRLKFTSRMRDMGDYDAFEPSVELLQETDAAAASKAQTFASCVVEGLAPILKPGPKVNRVVSWEERFRVVAHL